MTAAAIKRRYNKKATRFLIPFVVVITVLSISFMTPDAPKNDTIFFTSLNYAIQQGQFDGVARVDELRGLGNFGLGSEEKLAGELILLNGEFYSVDSKGKTKVMRGGDLIAFAAIKKFNTDKNAKLGRADNINDLEQQLSELINSNAFAAIKIEGTFSSMVFRSFETQQKPYKPIEQVPEVVFERKNIKGTIVGYYTPKSAQVMNSPTFHFHFIDDAKTTGGHVLGCTLLDASVEIDFAKEVKIELPDTTISQHLELNVPIK
jgi:acetolactate decarboxylase